MENNFSVCFNGVVEKIVPIEGADKIVQAWISGWETVIPVDKYEVGDKVIIAVTDAVIPYELGEGLGVISYLKHKKILNQFIVKTTKLRGVYSTAMIVGDGSMYPIGKDLMDKFKIEKYEEPEVEVTLSKSEGGKKIRFHKNPNFHVYYKFPNAKNVPGMFNDEDTIVITRKIHGTNFRGGLVKKPKLSLMDRSRKFLGVKWIDYTWVVGSHNVEKSNESIGYYSTNVYSEIAVRYKLQEKIKNYLGAVAFSDGDFEIGDGFIVYGEIYGPGIQKFYDYGLKDIDLVLFETKLNGKYDDIDTARRTSSILSVPFVEQLYRGKYDEGIIFHFQNEMLNNTIPHEGIVVRSVVEDRQKICKYINPIYLTMQGKLEESTDFH